MTIAVNKTISRAGRLVGDGATILLSGAKM
jgi:hypothetical protein